MPSVLGRLTFVVLFAASLVAIRPRVTFGGDGAVTECALSGRFRWTRTGACVKAALSAVRLAPFSGGPETMVHPFEVAPR